MSARPSQSPDSHRPTSTTDFTSDLVRTSELLRPQIQAQPRSILRQPPPHLSLSDLRGGPSEFEQQMRSHRQTTQPCSPEVRSGTISRHNRPSGMQLPAPRRSLVDAENDSVARACGKAPSPADYQPEFYGTQLAPHRGSELIYKKPRAPRARIENPREIYGALHTLLVSWDSPKDRRRLRVWDYLDWQDILAVQGWDYKDREERDRERRRCAQMRKNPHTKNNPKIGMSLLFDWRASLTILSLVVFGASLRDVILYASTTTVMGGITYDVPIIVHSCVDALLRTSKSSSSRTIVYSDLFPQGIYKPRLFLDFPNRRHCDELIDNFNFGPSYGERVNLNEESTQDVCFLLSAYLAALPEPLIDASLFEPFFVWCVQPSCKRDEAKRKIEAKIEEEARVAAHRRGELVTDIPLRTGAVTWTKEEEKENEELEKPQIAIAVVLFKALPAAHFALLVYLLRFFTQLPICPENGMSLEECANKFSEKMMGNTRIKSHQVMLWLLTRWPQISDGLFSESRAAYEEMKRECKRNAANSLHTPGDARDLSSRKELRGSGRTLVRSTTIGSVRLSDVSPTDAALGFGRNESGKGLYRSTTAVSAASYDSRRRSAALTEAGPQIEEKRCPAFVRTPAIRSNSEFLCSFVHICP